MAQYKHLPTVVEAEQWFPGKDVPGVFMHTVAGIDAFTGDDWKGEHAAVLTIHGQVAFLQEGDFVIREPDGIHFYPCKAKVFENTYELVEPAKEDYSGPYEPIPPGRSFVIKYTEGGGVLTHKILGSHKETEADIRAFWEYRRPKAEIISVQEVNTLL